jgi:hypothetical protein
LLYSLFQTFLPRLVSDCSPPPTPPA